MSNEYDFIIVGAGSAGCVLANRLTESGRYSVLLIEAGGSDKKLRIRVPIGYGFTYSDPSVNWKYSTAPDPGLNGRIAYWPRGKVVGGSSSINAMVYCRGLPEDFNDWAASGATGWDWQTVRAMYERTETRAVYRNGCYETNGAGPLWVTDETNDAHPVTGDFMTAALEAKWPLTDDHNGEQTEGLGLYRFTTRKGWRCSSADAFLHPARSRPNLRVLKHATVEHLLLEGKRVTGIAYRRNGRIESVKAGREVIVSAGSVNSPKLLQLSGIGPAEVLAKAGISVRSEMPGVGGGLQDHIAATYFYDSMVPTLNSEFCTLYQQATAVLKYALTRRGFVSRSINQCGGFIRSSTDLTHPDMQVYCNPATYTTGDGTAPSLDPEPGFILSFQPCRPKSRGRIDITSPDPAAAPRIDPNSLANEDDCEAVRRGARLLRHFIQTPTMTRLIKRPRQPDPSTLDDDAVLEDFRKTACTVYHPTSTCRMGLESEGAVLDPRLRVHGIGSLRVVDASAFPNITSGNTNAPTIMLAQRGADLILADTV